MSSDDEPFYSPYKRPAPPRQPRPGQHLWTVTHAAELRRAELRDHGPIGCELQILNEVEFVSGRRFDNRALALIEAERIRDVLLGQGWVCGRCAGEFWTCEVHPDRPANHDGCTEAGEPCRHCNTSDRPRPPRGFVSYVRNDDTKTGGV